MRGDFSRIRFEPEKHYTAVLEQQGRVALDADHNEQCAIDEALRRTEIVDVVGPFGGPEHDEGFAISVAGNAIQIGAGRYYVQGLLCNNHAPLDYGAQPFLINPAIADSDLLSELSNGVIDSTPIIPSTKGSSMVASKPRTTKFHAPTVGRRAPRTATPAQPVRHRAR